LVKAESGVEPLLPFLVGSEALQVKMKTSSSFGLALRYTGNWT